MLTDHDEKEYSSFMVNRALSYYRDTVLFANVMNQYPNLDKRLQYNFYKYIIRAQKRPYSKWHKKASNSDLIAVKELEQKKTPFIIRRPLPNGGSEYWRVQDLEIL